MGIVESVALGAVQGLTEFIPVSSSGHVILAEHVFSGASDHLFVEWINLGTVIALLIFFRKRIFSILHDIFEKKDYRLARNILIAAVPAGLVGFTLASLIEDNTFFSSAWTVVVTMAVVGVLLIILERLPKLSSVQTAAALPWWRALIIGVAQVFALVPGTSRSASTIIGGRLVGLNRTQAAEFSFLVSIPIMLGVLLKLAVKGDDRAYFMANLPTLLVANAVALIAGLFAVGFLMNFLKNNKLAPFGWYRLGLALLVAGVLLVQ